MSTPASALSKHYLAFSIVFIVVLVLLTVYCVLAPETEKFNVTPFPMVSPADLPDNQIQGTTCYDTLTRCDDAGQCSRCSSDFTCTYVSEKFYRATGVFRRHCQTKRATSTPASGCGRATPLASLGSATVFTRICIPDRTAEPKWRASINLWMGSGKAMMVNKTRV